MTIVESFAISLNISSDDVTYVSTEVVGNRTVERRLSTTYYTLTSNLQTVVLLSELVSQTVSANVTEVFASLTLKLAAQVSSGNFSRTLAVLSSLHNSTELSDAVADSVVNSHLVTTTEIVGDDDDEERKSVDKKSKGGLPIGAIVGIVIAGVVLGLYGQSVRFFKGLLYGTKQRVYAGHVNDDNFQIA